MNKKSILIIIIIALVVVIGFSFTMYKPKSNEQSINEQTSQGAFESATDFELKNLNGDKVKLSDYKGKVIVVNFFATWCPPCKAELPGFVKTVEEYKGKNVEFLFIDVGEDNATVKNFLTANGYNFIPLMDSDGKVSDIYGVRGIPTTFIINKNFEIKEQHVGFMDEGTLKDLIDAALKE